MDIYILDGPNGVKDIIDTFQSVIWTMQYSGLGDFELVLPGTAENVRRLPKGALLVREEDAQDDYFTNVMRVESRRLDFEVDTGWTLTVTGKSLKSILRQRVIWTQYNHTGNLEDGIRQVVEDNAVSPSDPDRAIPNLYLDAPYGDTTTADFQVMGENLGDWVADTCGANNLGWDIYIMGGQFLFTIYKGTDHTYDGVDPVVFSPEYDNLLTATYEEDGENYANCAVIGGEGEGTSQRIAHAGSGVGLDRWETYIDGSSVSSNGEIITLQTYLSMLKTYGETELAKLKNSEKFSGQVEQNNMFILGVDYDLGDLVQIDNGIISAQSRVTEIIYAEDESGFSLVPTFGTWEDD